MFPTYEVEHEVSASMSQYHVWERMAMFGLPLVDDEAYYRTDKYEDEDTPKVTVQLIELA